MKMPHIVFSPSDAKAKTFATFAVPHACNCNLDMIVLLGKLGARMRAKSREMNFKVIVKLYL